MERINALKRLLAFTEAEAEEILRRVTQMDTKMKGNKEPKSFDTEAPFFKERIYDDYQIAATFERLAAFENSPEKQLITITELDASNETNDIVIPIDVLKRLLHAAEEILHRVAQRDTKMNNDESL